MLDTNFIYLCLIRKILKDMTIIKKNLKSIIDFGSIYFTLGQPSVARFFTRQYFLSGFGTLMVLLGAELQLFGAFQCT